MSLPDYMTAGRTQRPLGITLLAVLHFTGGLGLMIVLIILLATSLDNPQLQEVFARLGVPIPLLIAGILLLSALGIASSIGMWRGARWGWHLGSFYYVYSILRNVSAMFLMSDLVSRSTADELASLRHGPGFYYLKFSIRVLISALIYLYFFKANVRNYFGLAENQSWKFILAQLLLCLVLLIAFTVAQ